MDSTKHIDWIDPRKKIWGFHVHQELTIEEFPLALLIQEQCSVFLKSHGVKIDSDDAIKPGYGPHLNYMWELRIENDSIDPLEKMGLALSFMAINRFGLSAYIHPLMHDCSLSEEDMLVAEGRENQTNAIWFSNRVEQNQDFFFNPPRDNYNKIIDTRSSRIISPEEKNHFHQKGKMEYKNNEFINPYTTIINGFHIHMDFTKNDESLALRIFDKFLLFLLEIGLRPTSTRIYDEYQNGPHIQSGWEVKFETTNSHVLRYIGIAIGWLMCNRQHISVFIHPVTWEEGDHITELNAHENYSMFIGHIPPLDLNFFRNKITTVA